MLFVTKPLARTAYLQGKMLFAISVLAQTHFIMPERNRAQEQVL